MKTPKQEAKELFDKFFREEFKCLKGISELKYIEEFQRAKECALICVDKIFNAMSNPIEFKYQFTDSQKIDWEIHRTKLNDYWQEVKEEINKL